MEPTQSIPAFLPPGESRKSTPNDSETPAVVLPGVGALPRSSIRKGGRLHVLAQSPEGGNTPSLLTPGSSSNNSVNRQRAVSVTSQASTQAARRLLEGATPSAESIPALTAASSSLSAVSESTGPTEPESRPASPAERAVSPLPLKTATPASRPATPPPAEPEDGAPVISNKPILEQVLVRPTPQPVVTSGTTGVAMRVAAAAGFVLLAHAFYTYWGTKA